MSLEPENQIVEPPVPESVVLRWALIGLGLNVLAVCFNLLAVKTEEINIVQRIGAAFMLAGVFISGCSLSLRPQWYLPWFLASASAIAATFALPAIWGSIPLLTHGLALVTAVIGIIMAASGKLRIVLLSGLIGFHYTGIELAILSPPPSPWIVFQLWQRGMTWWFDSIYVNNAYQFYAPDPGPANQLWFCFEYRKESGASGEPKTVSEQIASQLGMDELQPRYHRWVKLPTRPQDIRDPLGVSYYRRLAITEYAHQGASSNYNTFPTERDDILARRMGRYKSIPIHTQMSYPTSQFRPPNDLVRMMILPSYAEHLAHKYAKPPEGSEPGLVLHSIRFYRVLHEIVSVEKFGRGIKIPREKDKPYDFDSDEIDRFHPQQPYDPATYYPYFIGEYLPDGRLKNPLDPMLYWVIPIEQKIESRRDGHTASFKDKDYYDHYNDYLREHAGSDHREAELQTIQKK